MLTAIDITFGAAQASLLGFIILKYRPHIFISLHILNFWLFIVVFNGFSTYMTTPRYDEVAYLLVHSLVFLYLIIALIIGIRFRSASNRLISRISEIPLSTVVICLSLWLIVRVYLLERYGIASFNILATRLDVGINFWEVALNAYLWCLAYGAFLVYVIQITVRPRALLRFGPLFLAAMFIVFAVIFNETGGARRFLLLIATLVLLVALYYHGRRSLLYAFFVAILLVGIAEYYQLIRHNMGNPEFISYLVNADYLKAALVYLDPSNTDQSKSSLASFNERFSPFVVLYEITRQQLSQGTMTNGGLVAQSFLNVIPSIFVPGKTTINADELLANVFPVLPHNDLPSGVLAMLQSDFGFISYLFAPVLITLLILAYGDLIRRSRRGLLRVAFLFLAIGTAQIVEQLLDAILVQLRDVIVIVVIFYVLVLARRFLSNLRSPYANQNGIR